MAPPTLELLMEHKVNFLLSRKDFSKGYVKELWFQFWLGKLIEIYDKTLCRA